MELQPEHMMQSHKTVMVLSHIMYPGIFLAKCIIVNLSLSVLLMVSTACIKQI